MQGFAKPSSGSVCDVHGNHINPNVNGILHKLKVSFHLIEPPMDSAYLVPQYFLGVSSFNPLTLGAATTALGPTWVGGPVNNIDGLVDIPCVVGPPPIFRGTYLGNHNTKTASSTHLSSTNI